MRSAWRSMSAVDRPCTCSSGMVKPPKRSPSVAPGPDVVAVGGAFVVGGGGTVVAGGFVVAGDVVGGAVGRADALGGGAVTSGWSAMYFPRMARAALASDCVGRVLLATATVTAPARKLAIAT